MPSTTETSDLENLKLPPITELVLTRPVPQYQLSPKSCNQHLPAPPQQDSKKSNNADEVLGHNLPGSRCCTLGLNHNSKHLHKESSAMQGTSTAKGLLSCIKAWPDLGTLHGLEPDAAIYIYMYTSIYIPQTMLALRGFLLLLFSNSPVCQDSWVSALLPHLPQLPIACISGLLGVRPLA